jgi:phosphate transport system substrate-binding protein
LLTNHLNTACQGLSNPAYDWTGGVGGGPITWPGGATSPGTGSGGVVSVVGSTPGGIGYVGPSFVAPVVAGGLPTARLQNEHAYTLNLATFKAPTVTNTLNAFHNVAPPSNPDPFDLAILVPDPIDKNAYPIVGFTWLEAYECYNTKSEANSMKKLAQWYAMTGAIGSTPPDVMLEAQGLAPINSQWKTAVRHIANNFVKGPVTNVCTI